MNTIVFATGNKGKLKEAREIFPDYEILSIKDFDTQFNPVENGDTFLINACIKAEAALKIVRDYPVLSDDSGLVVPYLDGAPGVYSSRYAGENATDSDNLQKLKKDLKGIEDRRAWFSCSAVLLFPDYTLFSTEGRCEGSIAEAEKGNGGFGYDPVFVPSGEDRTLAEMESSEKHAISHRGEAFRKLERLLVCTRDLNV